MSNHLRSVITIVALLFLGGTALGQVVRTATLFGTVTDETRAVLPGVAVTITNQDTGSRRSVISDDEGRYRAGNLNLGAYSVRAELPGFQTVVRSGIQLSVGREARVDITLKVGEITDMVEVTGDAPLVETTSSTLSQIVDARQIRDLPLNGRDLLQLATLEAGISAQGHVLAGDSRGFAKQLSFAGARPQSNLYTLDGSDVRNNRNFASPEGVSGVWLGVEAVQEFEVVLNTGSAQYSNVAGGVLTAVTRSGTNNFHGSVFAFHRNDNLDASNFFTDTINDAQGNFLEKDKPEFKRNQFGFAAGGPIVTNRTFIFGTYEGVRQGLGVTSVGSTLSEDAKRGILPGLPKIDLDPQMQAIVDIYPVGVVGDRTDGTAELKVNQNDVGNEDFFTVRVDHHFGDNDSLFGRYKYDDGTRDFLNTLPVFRDFVNERSQNAVLEYKRIISPTVVNAFRGGYNRWNQLVDSRVLPGHDAEAMRLIPGIKWTNLVIPGITDDLGPDTGTPGQELLNRYEVSDDLSFIKGSHSIKVGFIAKFTRFFLHPPNRVGGSWEFDTVEDFLNQKASELRSASLTFDVARNMRQQNYAWYIQDDFQLRPGLTMNLGVRHEWITVPYETDGKVDGLVKVSDLDFTIGAPLFINPSTDSFAPRIGFAWDPRGDGRSSARVGFGIFYENIELHQMATSAARNRPLFLNIRAKTKDFKNLGLDFPDLEGILLAASPEFATGDTIQHEPNQPYVMQWNLTLQREITPGTAVTVGYVGSRGNHLMVGTEANTPLPTGIVDGRKVWGDDLDLRNPGFDSIRYRSTEGRSYFHALNLRFKRRFSEGLQVVAGYKLGKAIDDNSVVSSRDYGFRANAPDPDDLKGTNRGLASFDVRHNFNLNVISELPFGRNLTGLEGALVAGWRVSGILNLSSGPPFPVAMNFDHAGNDTSRLQRPDLIPGADNNPTTTGSPADGYIDPSSFRLPPDGTIGNLARNTVIGPGLATLDMAFAKDFPIASVSEDFQVQFRFEVFNVANRTNFGVPLENHYVFDKKGNTPAIFGLVRDTASTSRELQFGLKLLW